MRNWPYLSQMVENQKIRVLSQSSYICFIFCHLAGIWPLFYIRLYFTKCLLSLTEPQLPPKFDRGALARVGYSRGIISHPGCGKTLEKCFGYRRPFFDSIRFSKYRWEPLSHVARALNISALNQAKPYRGNLKS